MDWTHPLTKGLVCFYAAPWRTFLVGPVTRFGAQDRHVYVPTERGIARDFSVDNYGLSLTPAILKTNSSGGTLAIGWTPTGTGASDNYGVFAARVGSAGNRFYLRRTSSSGGYAGFGYQGSASTATGPGWPIGSYGVLSGSWGATGAKAYFNGRSFYSTATLPSTYTRLHLANLPTNSNGETPPGDHTYTAYGRVYWAAVFSTFLSDEGHLSFAENPYQILRPMKSRIFSLPYQVPILSNPGVTDITTTSVRPKVTLTF